MHARLLALVPLLAAFALHPSGAAHAIAVTFEAPAFLQSAPPGPGSSAGACCNSPGDVIATDQGVVFEVELLETGLIPTFGSGDIAVPPDSLFDFFAPGENTTQVAQLDDLSLEIDLSGVGFGVRTLAFEYVELGPIVTNFGINLGGGLPQILNAPSRLEDAVAPAGYEIFVDDLSHPSVRTMYIRATGISDIDSVYIGSDEIAIDNLALDEGGVAPGIEDAGPNGGDANGDGIPDRFQPEVASLPDIGLDFVSVEVSGDCHEVRNVSVLAESALPAQDPTRDYPNGLVGFTLPCETATVTLYLWGVDPMNIPPYRKFGPMTPGDVGNEEYYDFPHTTGSVMIDGTEVATITLSLTNGMLGDATDAMDGLIVAPGGVGVLAPPPPVAVAAADRRGLVVMGLVLLASGALALWERSGVQV